MHAVLKNMIAIMHGSETWEVYENNSFNLVIRVNYHLFIGSFEQSSFHLNRIL